MIIFAVFLGRDSMPLNMRDFLETAVRDRRIRGVSKRLLACLSGFFVPGWRIERSMAACGLPEVHSVKPPPKFLAGRQ
jgi:hypothetical protein